jgi:hypothetical protein
MGVVTPEGYVIPPLSKGGQGGAGQDVLRPSVRTIRPSSVILHNITSKRQKRQSAPPICKHSPITMPRDPPCPPLLRGGEKGLRLSRRGAAASA